MVDIGDEFFYKNVIDMYPDDESDDDFLTEAALLIHEHNVALPGVLAGTRPGLGSQKITWPRHALLRLLPLQQDNVHGADVSPLFSDVQTIVRPDNGWRQDEYVRMSESGCLEAMYRFCRAVIAVFGKEFLRQPTAEDTSLLLSINASRGFSGMLGSIDCMHLQWENFPFGRQGSYKGRSEGCTVILDAAASRETWIWHSFFGMAGSHNDINVLQRSPVFDRLAHGQSPDMDFEINGHHYNKGYYLADGIYPPWAPLVKTICRPSSEKEAGFAKEHEASRKDVERAFGILQSRWTIVRHPARAWSVQTMWKVITDCVIMYNMIVEVERDDSLFDNDWEG
ncbi:hypothetical protein QYE76_071835 [Lolium multiflorum]|uniref:DDE Tnp4 domain-containing protein n=1 Tax=Lolium multiflorum TaxID=4521 RepID=A0AAD8SMY8_LOLMU|nr:hypothetical protein QYE76_071835 [Lolium multiflorum]